jgi:predicted dinucleotide-binding enzyme
MIVGVLGSGPVAQTLGAGFIARGHAVMMASRAPEAQKVQDWVARMGPKASAGPYGQAAVMCDLFVLAVAWSGVQAVLRAAGAENLSGKVIIDVTNPLLVLPGQPPGLAVGYSDSGGETVQRWAPGSAVVKAFNIVAALHMVDPQFPNGPPTMFIAGDAAEAKRTVRAVLESFGWPDVVDLGGIAACRLIEIGRAHV